MGIYFDKYRVIGSFTWFIIFIFHFLFERKIIHFLKVDEKVINLFMEYISIAVFNCLINIIFEINSKHLVLINKEYILLYFNSIINITFNFLFINNNNIKYRNSWCFIINTN